MQTTCISLQTDNDASTPPLSFLQAGCPSCRPTNSVKALKAKAVKTSLQKHAQFPTSLYQHYEYINTEKFMLFSCTNVQHFHKKWYVEDTC